MKNNIYFGIIFILFVSLATGQPETKSVAPYLIDTSKLFKFLSGPNHCVEDELSWMLGRINL